MWRGLAVALVGLLLLSCSALAANPARDTSGNIEGVFGWSFSPVSLPRDEPAPIAFGIHTHIRTKNRVHLPPMRRLEWEADRHMQIDAEGMPTCHPLRTSDVPPSSKKCQKAIVGEGTMDLEIDVAETLVPLQSKVRIYNGGTRGERTILWIYGRNTILRAGADGFDSPYRRWRRLDHRPRAEV